MKKLLLNLGLGVVFLTTGMVSFAQTTFNYTGSVQSYTVPTTGNYKLEAWGAQGGNVNTNQGGNGGYAVGEKYLTAGTVLYIYVGGQGSSSTAAGWDIINGGYNGGGGIRRYTNRAASGGGASDISTVGGACTVDGFYRTARTAASYNARIIVGGGGGGFARATTVPGHGGGLNGDGATGRSNGVLQVAQTNVLTGGFGTQTSGGNAELYSSPDHATYAANSAPGSFGLGGTYYSAHTSNTAAGGGGAGYYGGGVNCHGNGGGGSSYIAGLTNASTTKGMRTGNGQIVITKLCDELTITGDPGTSVCEGTMITLNATSTHGGTVTWNNGITNGVPFAATSNMTYTATSTNTDDCVTPVNIVVKSKATSSQTLVECDGFSITVGTNTYNSTGIYTDVLTAANGCDSTVTTDLTVMPAITSSQTLVECDGFSITVGTNTYNSTGVYTDVLTAANGCDSTVTTDLTVMPAITSSQTLVECDGFSITVGTNTYNSTGVYTDVLIAANGCDSTVTTDLTVMPAITSSQTLVECDGFSITVGTNTYNTTGVYTDVLTAANGCDSTVTTDLTVMPAITSSQTLVECDGFSITVGTNTYNTTGVYTDVLTAANGCDSTVTTDLTVMPAITSSQTLVECDGFSITVGTNTYNSTGVYTDVLTAANGCDSTVTTDLTVLSVITSSQTLVECEGFSITVGTNTYNTTGVYTDVLTNVNGCDSTVTTDLTINTLPIVSISPFNPDTICLTDAVFDLPVGTLMGGTYSGAGVVDTTFDPNTAGVGSHYIVYSYTDANSCTNSDSTMITVDLCLGVEEESTISDLNVYPNPTTGMVYIDLGNHNEAVSYSISNIGGQVINQEVNVITDRIAIDLSNESKGIYLLKVESNTTTNVYKVIRK